MARTLSGAEINADKITVHYVENGEPGETAGPWNNGIMTAVNTLVGLVETAVGETVDKVQVYTASSNALGATNADPGDIIDVWTNGGNPTTRLGEGYSVTGQMAAARNALKSVLQAAL